MTTSWCLPTQGPADWNAILHQLQKVQWLEQRYQQAAQQLQQMEQRFQQAAQQLQQTEQRLTKAEQQLQSAVERMNAMQIQIDDLKGKPPIHIEYKFDQLKVNRLDGTLNIGLAPQNPADVESFEVPAPGMWNVPEVPPDEIAERIRALQKEAANYMDRDAPGELKQLASRLAVQLDQRHLQMVLNDVKGQLNERVHYYARTAPYPEDGTKEERMIWGRTVIDKTKRDVAKAFSAYLSNFAKPQAEGGAPDTDG